jgi:monoamine oxidase
MARTRLLNSLQRIANALAVPHGDAGRRRLIFEGTALGLLAAAPRWAVAATTRPTPRVAVVGAGLAGLTAAWTLHRAGVECRVFEASDRPGGRCRSEREAFAGGQVAERGGEFIDSVHHEIIALCKTLDLPLDDVLAAEAPGTAALTWIDGAPYSTRQATRDFQPVYPIVQRQARAIGEDLGYRHANRSARALDAISVAQWIDRHVPGGRASRLGRTLDDAYTEEFAVETTRISAVSLVTTLSAARASQFEPYAGSDQRFHVRGGNDRIVARLAQALGGHLHLETRLTAVTQSGDGHVRLGLEDAAGRREEVFDRVVLALPFSTLREVDLSEAAFRPLKMRAIRELPMGSSTKLQLQFEERFWNRQRSNGMVAMTGAPFHSTWEPTRAQAGRHGLLNFWSGGELARAAAAPTETVAAGAALDALGRVLEIPAEAWNQRVIRDAWHAHPWSRGSYAYYPVGYVTTVLGIEPEPEGRCHFAGEHTSLAWQGFLNGAVESGLRAAREVLRQTGQTRRKHSPGQ